MPSAEMMQSPAYHPLRPGSRRLLAFITAMVEHDGGVSTTLWDDQLADVVGSKSIITPGVRELVALGFVTQQRDIKRSTFTLSDQWRAVVSRREAILISAAARAPQNHRKWKQEPASASA